MSEARASTLRVVSVCLFCTLLLASSPTFADSLMVPGSILDGNPYAVTFPTYTGSGDFVNGALAGTLDYAVFTAAEFAAAFPGSSYSPTGAVVYAYQLENTGSVAISAEIVGVTNPASGIGSFEYAVGEQAPSSALFSSGNASWEFAGANALDEAEFSRILVFSSPNVPMSGANLVIDGGVPAVLEGVPTPSANPVPEPATFVLIVFGGACLFGLAGGGHRNEAGDRASLGTRGQHRRGEAQSSILPSWRESIVTGRSWGSLIAGSLLGAVLAMMAVVGGLVSGVQAGILEDTVYAYGGYQGSRYFSANVAGINQVYADFDFAAFAPGDFDNFLDEFGISYDAGVPDDYFVYAYQGRYVLTPTAPNAELITVGTVFSGSLLAPPSFIPPVGLRQWKRRQWRRRACGYVVPGIAGNVGPVGLSRADRSGIVRGYARRGRLDRHHVLREHGSPHLGHAPGHGRRGFGIEHFRRFYRHRRSQSLAGAVLRGMLALGAAVLVLSRRWQAR